MSHSTTLTSTATATSPLPPFPPELVGRKVLLATESLGPINGVSRTTQSLVDYLRRNGVHVATCAPYYKGQPIVPTGPKAERQPFVNPEWLRSIEAKSASLGSRAIGGAWTWHFDRDESGKQSLLSPPQQQHTASSKSSPMLRRRRSEDTKKKLEAIRLSRENPEFRLSGYPLPYNPDLTVAYPFRLGVVYDQTFEPDIIYLASPASVGFQFLIQLRQVANPPPTLLNFQTDLAAYATILFPAPLDRYGVYLLQMVQGYLFRSPAVRTIFYPSAYVRHYMAACGAPTSRMRQLGRGVDTESFHPKHRDPTYRAQIAPNGEIIFACVCRLAPEKGFDFLAQATRRLDAEGLNFKLLVVGGNTNPTVEAEVRSYFAPVAHRVVFTGMLRGEALARAYAVADVFLHCSVTETFGLVVLESMASGVPVIARDEGGPSETVKHDVSGYLVPPQDLETFVWRARTLALDAGLRARMAGAARRQALETTWEKINHAVAVELAATLAESPTTEEVRQRRDGWHYYGSLASLLRVYAAVGLVWVFWIIAVVPMLACGLVHGLFR